MFDNSLFAKLEDGSGYGNTHDEKILNPHVNFYHHDNTQAFARYLISEAVQMRGVEVFYLRREFVKLDKIFGEDMQSKFNNAYRVAMYLESFEGYEGQRVYFSKFGVSVNDEAQFTISPELFKHQCDGEKAREGDLIYFPMNNALFEITWVEPNNPFYQNGQESQYKITAQKFLYSGEELKPEFKPEDYMFDDQLSPIRNLDQRIDTSIIEFDEDNEVSMEADDFVEEFDVLIGVGTPKAEVPYKSNKPDVDPFAEFTV